MQSGGAWGAVGLELGGQSGWSWVGSLAGAGCAVWLELGVQVVACTGSSSRLTAQPDLS